MQELVSSAQNKTGGLDLGPIRAAVEPILFAHGVSLVDLEWLTERAGWVLRLTIERDRDPLGGVTLEDCAEVSRDVSAALDVLGDQAIPHRYNLEVSSPGLERRLRTPEELVRFAGHTAKVKLANPAPDGQKVLRGTIDTAPEGRVAVVVDGKRIEVPWSDVRDAHLVFELEPQPKKKPRGRQHGGRAKAR